MNKKCERCGTEFVDRSPGAHARFCSEACQQRSWYEANTVHKSEYDRNYREAKGDALRERSRLYGEAHKEAKREYDKAYREANKDAVREKKRLYHEANKEARHEYHRSWREANPEIVQMHHDRRRARKKGAFVENVDREAIYIRDGGKCQLCGKKVNKLMAYPHPQSATLDHILPLSKGGTHEAKNVQLVHFSCNSRKHNTGVDQLRMFGI